ncbi:HlyD family secretion protein [Anaerosinus massiliensis]|uniref:HlyD family secretion protein n=1 Tax=Massilibacillus massiliensis TaxID=1806837 RepID=UPI000A93897C|nr:HlyD family efflux transporter periplasmic adaptor subunit [Massilibacillus massiliensis]
MFVQYQKYRCLQGIVALVIILIGIVLDGCSFKQSQTEVWGRTEAKEVDINSKIAGRVVELLVKEGDVVKKGQVLARIDNRSIIAEVNQAKAGEQSLIAQLNQAATTTKQQDQTVQAALAVAQANLVKAQADLELAKSDFARFSKLVDSGAVSQQTFESYKSKYQVAMAACEEAKASVDSAEANLLQMESNRENETVLRSKIAQSAAQLEQTQVSLDETEIRAPFDGIITAKYVEIGAMISTGIPIVSIQDPQDNWINIKVAETELSNYQIGQHVALEGRDKQLKVEGDIIDISKKAEYATYRATNERDKQDIITFNVKIQVNSEKLRPGMRFRLIG